MQQPKQNTPEWYETRKNFIGASEASIVLGTNPWKNAYKLWEEKTGLKEPSTYQSPAMKEGSLREQEALEVYNKLTDRNCVDTVFINNDHKFMRASLDGYDSEKHVGVEIKCPQEKTFPKLCKEIPPYYYAQLQHQMVCSKLMKIDFFIYRSENTFHNTTVDYDENFCKEMIKKEVTFWENVVRSTPPSKMKGEFVERDSTFSDLCALYKELQENQKAIKDEIDFIFDKIVAIAENKNSYHGNYYYQKQERKGTIDYNSIPELEKVDLEQYRKPTCEFFKIKYSD